MKIRSAYKNSEAKKRKNDVIFLAVLLLVLFTIGIFFLMTAKKGDAVTVTVDKTVYGTYPLHENRTVEIRNGETYNLLIIRDGRAFVESATCPDGICAAHHPISRNGESIICLPNRVVITVSTENQNPPDLIA